MVSGKMFTPLSCVWICPYRLRICNCAVSRCGRTIGHLTVGDLLWREFHFFCVSTELLRMDLKAERRWSGTCPCDNEITIASRINALRAYEGKSSELIPRGPRSRVGTANKNGGIKGVN